VLPRLGELRRKQFSWSVHSSINQSMYSAVIIPAQKEGQT
jgi:hypothetical protein